MIRGPCVIWVWLINLIRVMGSTHLDAAGVRHLALLQTGVLPVVDRVGLMPFYYLRVGFKISTVSS